MGFLLVVKEEEGDSGAIPGVCIRENSPGSAGSHRAVSMVVFL